MNTTISTYKRKYTKLLELKVSNYNKNNKIHVETHWTPADSQFKKYD